MKKKRWIALLAGVVLLCAPALQAEQVPIRWIIQDGSETNQAQAERLYLDACRWIEERFGAPRGTIRPSLTIRVGESCPDPSIARSCQGSFLGDLYIPKWNVASPGDIVQTTLTMALLQLVPRQELHQVALDLINSDARNFLHAPMVVQKAEK